MQDPRKEERDDKQRMKIVYLKKNSESSELTIHLVNEWLPDLLPRRFFFLPWWWLGKRSSLWEQLLQIIFAPSHLRSEAQSSRSIAYSFHKYIGIQCCLWPFFTMVEKKNQSWLKMIYSVMGSRLKDCMKRWWRTWLKSIGRGLVAAKGQVCKLSHAIIAFASRVRTHGGGNGSLVPLDEWIVGWFAGDERNTYLYSAGFRGSWGPASVSLCLCPTICQWRHFVVDMFHIFRSFVGWKLADTILGCRWPRGVQGCPVVIRRTGWITTNPICASLVVPCRWWIWLRLAMPFEAWGSRRLWPLSITLDERLCDQAASMIRAKGWLWLDLQDLLEPTHGLESPYGSVETVMWLINHNFLIAWLCYQTYSTLE